jgi:peptidoglycan/LPS O-acetylase OafA/YrhL
MTSIDMMQPAREDQRAEVVPPPGRVRRPRLAFLDGLRLVAAISVAGYHYTVSWRVDGISPPVHFLPTASQFTIYGFLGVELFFLISGFVICMSSWGRTLGDFFTSRVTRLYPAYWVCILITALVVTLIPVVGGVPVSGQPSLEQIAINMTMLQEPMGVTSVDTVYWTLFVELRFYLIFALIVAIGLTYRRAILLCGVWMTVSVLAPALDSKLVDVLAIPQYAPYFIAGIAMYLIHRFGPGPLLAGIVGFAYLVSLERVGDRVADVHPGFPVPAWPGYLYVTVAYAVMLVVALGWTEKITWKWLTVAGAVTYPFYLLHQRIGYSAIRTGYQNTDLPVWVLVVMTMVMVLALAWLVHRFVERPLAPLVRSAVRRGIADARRTAPDTGDRQKTVRR